MWNPFKTPLPVGSPAPRELGFPGEEFAFPRMVDTNDVTGPSELTPAGDTYEHRSNTGELFQNSNPEYAMPYHPAFEASPGPRPDYAPTNPAVGSVDLAFPRDAGGVTGTDRLLVGDGPVTGENSQWTGEQGKLHSGNPNYAGPVTGGPDYSQQLSAAYFQTQAAQVAQEYANSAMVSAV